MPIYPAILWPPFQLSSLLRNSLYKRSSKLNVPSIEISLSHLVLSLLLGVSPAVFNPIAKGAKALNMLRLSRSVFFLASILADVGNAVIDSSISVHASGPKCSDVIFSLETASVNKAIPIGLVSEALAVISNATLPVVQLLVDSIGAIVLDNVSISDTYNISGRFCEPEVRVSGHQNHIQFLVHGATYNKNYWSGGDYPVAFKGDTYSWISYASKHGYPTLSIDRLGYGNSSHPDPVLAVQAGTEVQIHNQIIQALRNTTIVGGRKFSKVAYIGHSVGSVLGNYLATTYPDAADIIVLTGYSKYLPLSLAGILVTSLLAPAQLVADRFSALPLGYMAMLSEAGRGALFFSKNTRDFDKSILPFDFARQDTFALGEAVTIINNPVASDFTNPILVITGHEDQAFCGLGLPELGELTCGTGAESQMNQTQTLFPNADYHWVDVPNTGHNLNFHYSAQSTFKEVHDFLDYNKF